MADEDKDKAEKLAAAKKRFEELKKDQQKKGKKGGGKKKGNKAAAETAKAEDAAETAKTEDSAPAEDAAPADDATDATTAVEEEKGEANEDDTENTAVQPEADQKVSESVQSKQRSESFRQGSAPTAAAGEVQEVYRKQAARIEELEKENKTFKEQKEESSARLTKTEEELEKLREDSSDMAELKTQAQDAERLKTELESTQRQLAQSQQATKDTQRRASAASPGVAEQLAAKTSSLEALELEMSNLRNQITGLETTVSERDASAQELEDRAKAAETATDSVKQELDALKGSMSSPSEDTKAASEDPETLTKRITVLESDLRTAHTDLDAAASRASSLEQKIEALTKLHREATTTSQTKDKELADLRSQLKRRDRPSHVRDASDFELGEEETETGGLQARIRALEAENFDLRRGVWREKRAELQPGMGDENMGPSHEYEDVDLNGPYSPASAQRQPHSSFQDVITSGISAFTGRAREQSASVGRGRGGTHARKQSLGLLSEDGDDFDPEAFRVAQEEEARRRVERVKEVKRGLEKWKGWRVDVSEMRTASGGVGGGRECGPVFQV